MTGALSPDGNWMFLNGQWVPAPPKIPPKVNLQPPNKKSPRKGIMKFIIGLFGALGILIKMMSWLSGTSENQKLGYYKCISGHVEHATHWIGTRKCGNCGKTMSWYK